MAIRPGYIWNSTTGEWDAIGTAALPNGGTTGQVLAKASGTDQDATWVDTVASSELDTLTARLDAMLPGTTINTITLTRDDSRQGVFYRIGTGEGLTGFANPATQVNLTASTTHAASGPVSNVTDRSVAGATEWFSDDAINSYIYVDLGVNRTLACGSFSLQQRNSSNNFFRDLRFECSSDGTNWTTLYTGTATGGASTWWEPTFTKSAASRYFRMVHTGFDSYGTSRYFAVASWELYGDYNGPTTVYRPVSPLLLMGA